MGSRTRCPPATAIDRAKLPSATAADISIRLWTIQTAEALAVLRNTGRLSGSPDLAFPGFRRQYRWMMAQMAKRLPTYGGGYPIWAWYRPKPDLRARGHLPAGTPGVRLGLTVDSSRVLLSDFDAWHSVLNDAALTLSEPEDDAFYARFGADLKGPGAARARARRAMRSTWERVFDLKALSATEWLGGARHVQAVLEEIRIDDVLSARAFVAR